jgi:hypothetical protein
MPLVCAAIDDIITDVELANSVKVKLFNLSKTEILNIYPKRPKHYELIDWVKDLQHIHPWMWTVEEKCEMLRMLEDKTMVLHPTVRSGFEYICGIVDRLPDSMVYNTYDESELYNSAKIALDTMKSHKLKSIGLPISVNGDASNAVKYLNSCDFPYKAYFATKGFDYKDRFNHTFVYVSCTGRNYSDSAIFAYPSKDDYYGKYYANIFFKSVLLAVAWGFCMCLVYKILA